MTQSRPVGTTAANDILETIDMIEKYRLDIRTVTMGINLLPCIRADVADTARAVHDTVTRRAARLVEVCEGIERELGVPIVNKRISVTPVSLLVGASGGDPVVLARALDRAAKDVGVNFIGGTRPSSRRGCPTPTPASSPRSPRPCRRRTSCAPR